MIPETILLKNDMQLGFFIKQPNRITTARFTNYTLMMRKVITAISIEFSSYVEESYNGKPLSKMDLFKPNTDKVILQIPYKNVINDPSHFKEVDNAVEQMAGFKFKVPYVDKNGDGWKYITNFFTATLPDRHNKKFEIQIEKWIAELFIMLDSGANGNKIYTKFLPEICFNAISKYTSPIYQCLASWRKKEMMLIRLDELYDILGITDGKYKRYCDFKKKILKKVQADLKNNGSDIWFDCDRKDFKFMKNGEIWLRFKLISNASLQRDKTKVNQIFNILRNLKLNEKDIKSLEHIIYDDKIQKSKILDEIVRIEEYIINSSSTVTDKTKYMTASLLKSFRNG